MVLTILMFHPRFSLSRRSTCPALIRGMERYGDMTKKSTPRVGLTFWSTGGRIQATVYGSVETGQYNGDDPYRTTKVNRASHASGAPTTMQDPLTPASTDTWLCLNTRSCRSLPRVPHMASRRLRRGYQKLGGWVFADFLNKHPFAHDA